MRRTSIRIVPTMLLGLAAACGGVPPAASPPAVAPPAVVAIPAAAASGKAGSPDDSLGHIDFQITGSAACQAKFREGMLALHSFLYEQAHDSFAAALAADPACAMAAWGDAMSNDHPIWEERDVAKGRAALAKVGGEDTVTPKERAYLAAARALYSNDDLKDAHEAWLAAAATMHAEYPDDDEVALQHALAILAVYGYKPAHVREQMEAGAIALAVLARHPDHPGAAHYAIHAFDSRAHAILALPAARIYARIAPKAFHALHMPSHIFVQLGMWKDVVPSNEKAYAASVAWATAHGRSPAYYDWHSYSWLVAAHLELGQPAAARKLIDDARAILATSKDDTAILRSAYGGMVEDYVSQTDRWSELETLVAPLFAPAVDEGPEGKPVACASHAPGGGGSVRYPAVLFARLYANLLRAEAAVRTRDEASVAKRVAEMKTVRSQMTAWAKMLKPEFETRWDAIGDALLARAHDAAKPSPAAHQKAILALEHLAHLQVTETTGGPEWERTAQENLGEALLAGGNAKYALAEFSADLEEHPKRALALLDAARAAKAAGDAAAARAYYGELAELWSDAEPDLPALDEVRSGAK